MSDSDDWFTLAELTGRLGSLVWVEAGLAEVLAGWSSIEAHAGAAVLFATTSGHHSWHAAIVRSCLPTTPSLLDPDVVTAPTTGWIESMNKLRAVDDPEATTARLKAVARVIDPWLDREYGALRDLARPISDAPMMRWLNFAALDHDHDGDAAAQLLTTRTAQAVRFDQHVLVNELRLT